MQRMLISEKEQSVYKLFPREHNTGERSKEKTQSNTIRWIKFYVQSCSGIAQVSGAERFCEHSQEKKKETGMICSRYIPRAKMNRSVIWSFLCSYFSAPSWCDNEI